MICVVVVYTSLFINYNIASLALMSTYLATDLCLSQRMTVVSNCTYVSVIIVMISLMFCLSLFYFLVVPIVRSLETVQSDVVLINQCVVCSVEG